MEFTNNEYIKDTIFIREETDHKGTFGKVLIFAGSAGMSGAAILCGKSVLKAGAGLAQFLIPWRAHESPVMDFCSVLQTAVPEATCVEYNRRLNFNRYPAIAAGPGIGTGSVSARILRKILRTYEGVLVLDADALNIIAKKGWKKEVALCPAKQVIITPHVGEAKRLLGGDASIKTDSERVDAACLLADIYNCIAVLKGARTLIAAKKSSEEDAENSENAGFEVFKNTTGNPGMATGGSGDVLTGVIASLAAQGYSPLEAARIGVFIHGLAGDICAREIGEMGMISSDICAKIPAALHMFY